MSIMSNVATGLHHTGFEIRPQLPATERRLSVFALASVHREDRVALDALWDRRIVRAGVQLGTQASGYALPPGYRPSAAETQQMIQCSRCLQVHGGPLGQLICIRSFPQVHVDVPQKEGNRGQPILNTNTYNIRGLQLI
jgi:hypothetical protein